VSRAQPDAQPERVAGGRADVRISTSKFVAPKLVQAIAKGLPKPRAEAFKKAAACTAR
jgi:hypothetical protein